ncbi:hypothetical protein [Paraburkholderia sp. A3RO-2L]|jgi:predicted protein tyrosine phosphatase|uniref:hypothetical protein n=1 Tax=unclassified Paraburkholderia TaxID=2615204 RepID=UPI003DA8ECC4
MQHIRFLPRAVAETYRPDPGSVLISIHDRSEPPMTPRAGWADVLVLRFHDTDGAMMGMEVFSDDQARQVLDFVGRHQECTELVVHCQMGQSRSAAVALYLSEKYGVPCFKEHRQVNWESWKVYNRLVYRTLHTADQGPMLG